MPTDLRHAPDDRALHASVGEGESSWPRPLLADPYRGVSVRRGLPTESPHLREVPARTFPPGQVSDPMAPNGNLLVIFTEINMPSDLVELGGLEPPAPCLQSRCSSS